MDPLAQEVYEQLKGRARRLLAQRPTEPLHPTELVHEAWAKLSPHRFESEAHYKAVAGTAMVQILADHARARHSAKREGIHTTLTGLARQGIDLDLVALHEGLVALQQLDQRSYDVVTLRYLGGMTVVETAEWLDLSERTVHGVWRLARVWLLEQLGVSASG